MNPSTRPALRGPGNSPQLPELSPVRPEAQEGLEGPREARPAPGLCVLVPPSGHFRDTPGHDIGWESWPTGVITQMLGSQKHQDTFCLVRLLVPMT